jgi:tetratricopeptide (TPR) repeat protein
MKNKSILLIVSLLICTIKLSFSLNSNFKNQDIILDSLWNEYKKAKHDTTKCNIYLKIGNIFKNENPDTALYFYNQTLKLAALKKFKKQEAYSLYNIGLIYYYNQSYNKALDYYLKSLKIKEELGDKKGISNCCFNIGNVYEDKGNYDKAIEFLLKSLNINKALSDKKAISNSYNSIGNVYSDMGNYDKALDYYLKSLKIREDLGDKKGKSHCYNNIGIVYADQNIFDKALDYYFKALKINVEMNDIQLISSNYTNIGIVYYYKSNYIEANDIKKNILLNTALDYFLKSLRISEKSDDKNGMSNCYTNISNVYSDKGKYEKALEYYLKSLKIDEELGEKRSVALVLRDIAKIHITIADSVSTTQFNKIKHYNEAVSYGLKAINLAKEINTKLDEGMAAKTLMEAYKKLGNYKKSIESAEIFIDINDSLFGEEKTKALAEMGTKYESEKKQLQIDKLGKERELQLSENKKQKIIIWFVVSGLILLVLIAVVILHSLRITRKQKNIIEKQKQSVDEKNTLLCQQNEEITAQRDEIQAQRDEITDQRDEITAQRDLVTIQKEQIEKIHLELSQSINYATRIQTAILPDPTFLNHYISEHFVIFRPKDKVSGDFYWWALVENYLIITVADCTGHGVPGAFMSMLGTSFLREIVVKEYMTNPAIILKRLRKEIIQALKQKGDYGEQKDGMDMALIVLNTENMEVKYAGANNPLYIVRKSYNKIEEIRPDKMPVAIYENMQAFTNHEISLQKGDCIYMMSDGYQDQFGGPHGKKFLSKKLKELLETDSHLSMEKQKELLEKAHDNWKADREQIDDITIIGLKI